jgi:hypothetical protein
LFLIGRSKGDNGKNYLSFNREDFLEIGQSETRIACGGHVCLAKGNMSFCHHLVSVICHLFTFHILIFSSENPQPNELKLGKAHIAFGKAC